MGTELQIAPKKADKILGSNKVFLRFLNQCVQFSCRSFERSGDLFRISLVAGDIVWDSS